MVANPAAATAGAWAETGASFDPWTWGKAAGALALTLLVWFAARSAPIGRLLAGWAAPLRPVHLPPLDPTAQAHRRASAAQAR